jgi:trk system potassium uptake protein TrkA
MPQFVVVGLGAFGSCLAIALEERGHEVIAIDMDAKKVQHIKDQVTHAVVSDAMDFRVLDDLVGRDVRAVVVDLGETGSSLFTVAHVREISNCRVIAKARDELHGKTLRAVGADDVVFPEQDVALRLAERLHNPNLVEYIPLAPGFSIVEVPSPPGAVGKTLSEMEVRTRYGIHVLAIRNVPLDTLQLVPDPNARIPLASNMIVLGRQEDIEQFQARHSKPNSG